MLSFSINGQRAELPIALGASFKDLLGYIRAHYTSDNSLITAIRVDGIDLETQSEGMIERVPVTDLGSIEVFTAHPKELAEETLQTLIPFVETLEKASQAASEPAANGIISPDFNRLMDGLAIMTDAITQVKEILRIGSESPVAVLEADLNSLLHDLFAYHRDGRHEYVAKLLLDELPRNFVEWRLTGIPALIRFRDS